MKVNTSDFFVETRIIDANENEIIYDLPRQRIQETWDKLSAFYIEKSLEENKVEAIENEFYLDLANAKVENETAMTAFDLINKNIIKKYDCKESKELKSNAKRHILSELLHILTKGIEELKENIRDEEIFYQEAKEINSEIRIFEKSIQIVTNQLKYIDFEEYRKFKKEKSQIGLFCSIKMNGIELKGFHSCEEIFTILDCKSFEGTHLYKGIEVSIKNEYSEIRNEIITSFIQEIYYGKQVNELLSAIPVLFSRYFLNQLICNSSKKLIVETSNEKRIDKLSSIFYCITDQSVLKIVRNDWDFKIFSNGKLIKIKNES